MTKHVLPPTEPYESGVSDSRRFRPGQDMLSSLRGGWRWRWRERLRKVGVSPWMLGGIALTAAIASAQNPTLVQQWERNIQTVFFDLRGRVEPPSSNPQVPNETEIVILAMDGDTMTQGTQIYPTDPQQYAYFAPIQQWPWQRTAYAIVIDRLMQAGARAVVLDVVLDANSSYGDEDDERLRQVLQKYSGRVTLASKYVEEEKRTGVELQLLTPNPIFQSADPILGFINLPISPNGRMHELGDRFFQQMQEFYAAQGITVPQIPAFAAGALQAAQINYPEPLGQDIFFYGPSQTFRHIPFWHVLDPQNWNSYHLKNNTFRDKIVLIGPTGGGESFQDFHEAPFSGTLRYPEKLAGVEIQANAIATLMQGRTLVPVFANEGSKGLFVGAVVLAAGYWLSRRNDRLTLSRLLRRPGYGIAIAIGYGIFSYIVFVQGRLILPTAVPMLAIVGSSAGVLFVSIVQYQRRLRRDAKRLPDTTTEMERDSDVETPDIKDVWEQQQQEIIGKTLKGRYKVLEKIGEGGFGQTYRAQDLQRPGNPPCVVKQLRPQNRSLRVIKLAETLFEREAIVLQQLGTHDQIPDLLAFFQDSEDFYLVQQYIDGYSLADELTLRSPSRKITRPLSEQAVVMILSELLNVLAFVHQQGVIHRDIKPANIIRRRSDRKMVLIDFGAVKQVRELEVLEDGTQLTVPIGTNGYMSPEQAQGKPCPASDIYSLGMTGIRALTGIEPKNLDTNNQSGESQGLDWRETVRASDTLIQILEKMIRVDVRDRYQTVQDVMDDLQSLVKRAQESGYVPELLEPTPAVDDDPSEGEDTKHWQPDLPDIPLPLTDPDHAPTDHLTQGETQIWKPDHTDSTDSV